MQCNPENAEYQEEMLAFKWFPYAAVIQIAVCCTSHWTFSFGAKGFICSDSLGLQITVQSEVECIMLSIYYFS